MTQVRLSFWKQVGLSAAVAALLLVLANSAIWVNRTIFNTETFTDTAVTSLTSESSRQALAQEVVDRALADRPTIKNVAGGTATKLISGLLGSDRFSKVLETSVSRLQIYLTSKDQKSIEIDLTGVKTTVDKLITVADTVGANTDNVQAQVSKLPDQITLLDADKVPSFYTYSLVFLWLGPLCAVAAFGLLIYPYFRDRRYYYKIAMIQGAAVVGAGLLALLLGPLFRPPALSSITSPNMRIVVGNLYDAFLDIFNRQTYVLIVMGLLLAAVPWLVHLGLNFYGQRVNRRAKK